MLLMAGYVQHAYEKCISIPLMNDLSIDKIAYFHWEILLVSNNKKKDKRMRKKEKRGHYLQTPAVRKSSLPLHCTFLLQAFHFWEKKKITNIVLMNENPVLPCRLVCVKLLFFSHLIKASFHQWGYWTKIPPWTWFMAEVSGSQFPRAHQWQYFCSPNSQPWH